MQSCGFYSPPSPLKQATFLQKGTSILAWSYQSSQRWQRLNSGRHWEQVHRHRLWADLQRQRVAVTHQYSGAIYTMAWVRFGSDPRSAQLVLNADCCIYICNLNQTWIKRLTPSVCDTSRPQLCVPDSSRWHNGMQTMLSPTPELNLAHTKCKRGVLYMAPM